VGIVALSWSLVWMLATMLGRRRRARWRTVALSAGGILVLLWASSPTVVGALQTGMSEYPTWIALPFLVPLLFASSATRCWMGGALLLGLSLSTRTNHLPAVLGMLAVFLWRGAGLRPRAAMGAGLLFGVIALLPGLHNYYYGGQIVPLTTSAGIPENLVLPPARLLDVRRDAEIRRQAWNQARRMLYVTEQPDRILELAVRGLQTMWVVTVAVVLLGYRPGRMPVLLLGVPVLYLVPHALYQTAPCVPAAFPHRLSRDGVGGPLRVGGPPPDPSGQSARALSGPARFR
jgi:hypothetical protein